MMYWNDGGSWFAWFWMIVMMLIVWGGNDQIFPAAGAVPYKRDLKTVEFHLLDAGHFALESEGDLIARLMRDFLGRHVAARDPSPNQEV